MVGCPDNSIYACLNNSDYHSTVTDAYLQAEDGAYDNWPAPAPVCWFHIEFISCNPASGAPLYHTAYHQAEHLFVTSILVLSSCAQMRCASNYNSVVSVHESCGLGAVYLSSVHYTQHKLLDKATFITAGAANAASICLPLCIILKPWESYVSSSRLNYCSWWCYLPAVSTGNSSLSGGKTRGLLVQKCLAF